MLQGSVLEAFHLGRIHALSHSKNLSVARDSLRHFHPEYAKPIFQDSTPGSQWIQCTSGLKVHLPYENAPSANFTFKNNSNDALTLQMTFADSHSQAFCIPPGEHDFEIDLRHINQRGQMVINNAGSEVTQTTLDTKDRGIFQPDLGQYETPKILVQSAAALSSLTQFQSKESPYLFLISSRTTKIQNFPSGSESTDTNSGTLLKA